MKSFHRHFLVCPWCVLRFFCHVCGICNVQEILGARCHPRTCHKAFADSTWYVDRINHKTLLSQFLFAKGLAHA
ncbi:hypothetical protein B0H14DRAFT_80672 [Mycena olivaceomarginata]|nr:hypothetical protein B0H14DRAFT_80672 [Mycena olivaceomarginata]